MTPYVPHAILPVPARIRRLMVWVLLMAGATASGSLLGVEHAVAQRASVSRPSAASKPAASSTADPVSGVSTASRSLGQDPDQNVLKGLDLYGEQRFEEAALSFQASTHPIAPLFVGKSLYLAGRFQDAIPSLLEAGRSEVLSVAEEASYVLALCHIQLREYPPAVAHLSAGDDALDPDLRARSTRLLRQTIGFLTDYQLLEVLRSTQDVALLSNLYRYASASTSPLLLDAIRTTVARLDPDAGVLPRLPPVITSDGHSSGSQYRVPPDGFSYSIGVVLPAPEEDPDIVATSKELYQGILSAIELLQQDPAAPRIHVRYLNTHAEKDSLEEIVRDVWLRDRVDVLIGPLFSDNAVELSRFADLYRIPVVAPLANSDGIRGEGGMTVQLNPPFSVHGRAMARFAVRELGFDTLAVISDTRSFGYGAATAFKEEAERLGALISTFYAADLASIGFDISPFTDQLVTDTVLIDSLGIIPPQAIYAPFTGQAAGNLSRLLLTDLEGKRSRIPILGSEEWSSYAQQTRRRHDIHYSTPFNPAPDSVELERFSEQYESRFAEPPGFYATIGYDTGRFVAQALRRSGNPAYLQAEFRRSADVTGLALRIALRPDLINSQVYIQSVPVTPPRPDSVRVSRQ